MGEQKREGVGILSSLDNNGIRTVIFSVIATLVGAGILGGITIYGTVSKLTISVEQSIVQLEKRITSLEKEYKRQQELYTEISVGMAKIENTMDIVSRDVQDNKVDVRALLIAINSKEPGEDGRQNRGGR